MTMLMFPKYFLISREAKHEAPRREVYNLVAREARVFPTSIARPK